MRPLLKLGVLLFEDIEIVLPLPILNRTPDSCKPFIEDLLLIEAYMHSSRLLIGVVIDRLEDEAIVLLIFGEPKQVILEIIGPDPGLLLSEKHMPLRIQSEYLLLPSLDIEAARVPSIVDEITALDGWGLEDVSNKGANIPHNSDIVLHLLLPTQSPEGLHQLLRQRFLLRLLLSSLLVGKVEVLANGVLAEL